MRKVRRDLELIPLGIQSNSAAAVVVVIIIIYLGDYNISLGSEQKSLKSHQPNSDSTLYTKGNGGLKRLSRLNKVTQQPSQE